MTKVLGLDLGTNSIGWAVVEKQKGNEAELLDKGVLIFTEGVKSEKGVESSRAAFRTEKRSARRIKFRRKLRKYETLKILASEQMCPLSFGEVIAWRKSGFKKYPTNPEFLDWLKTDDDLNINPYKYRDKASREKVSKRELGRALYHIAQRRGFWSNRLDKSDEGIIEQHKPNLEVIFENTERLVDLHKELEIYFVDILDKRPKDLDAGEKELKKLYNFFIKQFKIKDVTLELLVAACKKKLNDKGNLGVVKRNISDLSDKIAIEGCTTLGQYFWVLYQRGEKIRNHYTDREKHYLFEFELICKVQGINVNLSNELKKAIFYQRSLKSQKGLIGKCSLETNKARCSTSHPDFEKFKMLQFINSIKVFNEDGKKQALTNTQKLEIESLFFRKSKPYFDFSDISKRLQIDANKFNYNPQTTVSGCPTSASLKLLLGDEWNKKIFKSVNDKGKPVSYDYKDLWHVLFTFNSSDKLQEFAESKLGLSKSDSQKFSQINLRKDYSSLSLKAINKILVYLNEGLLYSHAVFMSNMQNVVIKGRWDNKKDRELIQNEVKKIIENHQLENKKKFVVNSCVKNCKDNFFTYSKEAEQHLRKDLNKVFEKEYGINTWSTLENKETILEESFKVFIECLQSTKREKQFLTIKRIDEKVIDFLDDNDLLANKHKMFHPSDLESFKPEIKNGKIILGNPVTGSIKNPMAMRAMYQLRKIVNTLIEEGKIDERTKINIELARELNDANKRKAIEKWQKDRNSKKKEYIKSIKELFVSDCGKKINPTDEDVLKYELWLDQNQQCLYTEGEKNTIGICDVVGEGANCEIEHTIPRSISFDNTKQNLTIAHKIANNKKGNKTPFEIGDGGNGLASHDVILSRIAHWKEKYESINIQIKQKLRATKAATTKEQKDKLIQQRHYLKMDYAYWRSKYDSFILEEVPSGFTRRQLVDIGIISKYAQAYLKSVFPRVYSVKGSLVAEFRKAWGLHDTYTDSNGRTSYVKKDRGNHTHHCKDAVTIACMDKHKYDKMAEAWAREELGDLEYAKNIIAKLKPWKTFTEDVRNLEKEILVVHHTKDVVPIQTKKKVRKRGKIQYSENGKPKFEQGDTIRGSLHKDTFYGAIASKSVNGIIVKDEKGGVVPAYVERVKLENLKKTQVDKIVDEGVKAIIKQAVSNGLIKFGKTTSISNEGVWMNVEKGIPINKVRVFAHIKSPLKVKNQRDKKEGVKYKHHYYAANDENYCMAIYEGRNNSGKIMRSSELVNLFSAAKYFKRSNESYRNLYPIAPEKDQKGYPLKYLLTKGKMVLLYESNQDEIWELTHDEKLTRLFEITQLDVEGAGIKLLYHQEAREKKIITESMGLKTGMKGGKNIGCHKEYPWIKVSANNFDALLEGVNFKISPLGEIQKM